MRSYLLKYLYRPVFTIGLLVTLILPSISQSQSLRAGAATNSITPAQPVFLAGYGGAGLSVGVHDSLYVKAVVISTENKSAAIVTLDCIGLLNTELNLIRKKLVAYLSPADLHPDHIILSSTHTHLGPDVVGLWGKHIFSSGVQPAYMDFLITQVASTIAAAWKNQQDAVASWAKGSFGDGWVQNISLPQEIDRSVLSIQFRNKEGNSIATLTNFACHPTIIGAERKLISSDYVAGFYNHMNNQVGGVNLFLQGAIGGWVQPVGEDSFEHANMRGQGLAEEVISILEQSVQIDPVKIEFLSRRFQMPVKSFGFKLLSALGVLKREIGRSVTTEIAWLQIGQVQFITHPGETSPHYGLETRKLFSKDTPVFVLGLAQDALGYLLKPEFFNKQKDIPHANYLTKVSVGKYGGPVLMNEIKVLVEKGR